MPDSRDVERAHRLTRKRASMLPLLAIIFISQQAAYFSDPHPAARLVDHVKIGAWLVLSIVLLLVLATGGAWLRSKEVRALMEDEVTRANRADAFRLGFLATMAAGVLVYFLDQFAPMAGREAVHILVTVGIATALLRFGYLERRALKEG